MARCEGQIGRALRRGRRAWAFARREGAVGWVLGIVGAGGLCGPFVGGWGSGETALLVLPGSCDSASVPLRFRFLLAWAFGSLGAGLGGALGLGDVTAFPSSSKMVRTRSGMASVLLHGEFENRMFVKS